MDEFRGFGWALKQMQEGKRVRRAGWNGKNMWIAYTPGSTVPKESIRPGSAMSHMREEIPDGGTAEILPHIDMRTATGALCVGWLASQTDMLAIDWEVVS